ncbi:sugar phosphate nucleotidyltransferase [Mesobacillus selenatarsenatis]|uniref:NTP transferase domain-containing protein n=1 Tax=Mesobacillus selenatarsenatis TaxID=388741 RepID=A0A846U0L1_9BACI|nr:sugar phosphate nucleotidyltransferase [Mesobacillus selenatarsenatis]NKE08211.1 NTP transferase domain-containing protein [Mesobacillus selenatarsenatis]
MKAIILAAGMGTRLRPLTSDTPKALVKVNGKPMAERQIEFLIEKGIEDITILTGYLHEKFDYLKEKYGVKLIHNDKYAEYNNIYTMYLVKDLLPGSYVLEGDVFMNNNVLEKNLDTSLYFSNLREEFQNEWVLVMDESGKVVDIEVRNGENDYIMSGISYWSDSDGKFIANKLDEIIKSGDFKDLYWDDVVKLNIKEMNIHVRKMLPTDSFEIDSVEDLKKVEGILVNEE